MQIHLEKVKANEPLPNLSLHCAGLRQAGQRQAGQRQKGK